MTKTMSEALSVKKPTDDEPNIWLVEKVARAISKHIYIGQRFNFTEQAKAAIQAYEAHLSERWIKTTDRLPDKPGKQSYEYVDCLIFYKGEVLQRPWNCEHLCWDDAAMDDFELNPTEPTHWMPLPAGPAMTAASQGDK